MNQSMFSDRKQYHNDTDEAVLQLIGELITGKDNIVCN